MAGLAREDVYPVTTKFERQLAQNGLTDPLGEVALEYIGEYEHGSADYDGLMPKRFRALYASGDQALQDDLLEYAAKVLEDFLLYYRISKEL